MLVETCLRNEALIPILKKIGYSSFLIEGGGAVATIGRITLTAEKYPHGEIDKAFSRGHLVFFRPNSRDSLIKVINDERVCCVVLDNTNLHLYKRPLVRLMVRKGKFVEVWLRSSSHEVVRRAIELGNRGLKTVFSSCPSKISEVWSPISKLNYLLILGASSPLALTWIYSFPLELYRNASANY